MRFQCALISGLPAIVFCLGAVGPVSLAQTPQNSIQLFSPIVVRLSDATAGYGAAIDTFNSTTLNLNCQASPITAVLSSTPDSSGYLLVDNNLNLTVTAAGKVTGPTNVCVGGVNTSPVGPFPNCFTPTYETEASDQQLTNQDPDNFVLTGGVLPIDVSKVLVSGPLQLKIDLQDEGGYLANSTLYLNTNCAQGGVTGPALISGNPISSTDPTADELSQNFSFSSTFGQQIGFQYDLTAAQAAKTLTIVNQTIPGVGDMPLDPAVYQSKYVPGTSFATSSCLIHAGELLPNGNSACKVYTLDCKVGTDGTATGAQCPISSMPNEIFQDEFDGPNFTLPDIATPNGPTFHTGIGFLMAKEGWTGGPCLFDPAANLTSLDCPQNLLTNFASAQVTIANVVKAGSLRDSLNGHVTDAGRDLAGSRPAAVTSAGGSGSNTSTGRTTHPNSTFLTIAGVPEDLTTVTVAGQQPGYWINKSSALITLSSQPPNLSGTTLPGAAGFVASPIQSITYGVASAGGVPVPGDDLPMAVTRTNDEGCPAPGTPGTPATFNPGEQTLSGLSDGYHLIYYYALDCAGTEELKFSQDSSGYWSTNFYTVPVNVDTVAPAVASGPTLSPAPSGQGTYALGQPVTASYSCTDALSGVVRCNTRSYAVATGNTGTLTSAADTASPGAKTFTVTAVDAAGNQSAAEVKYQVVGTYDNLVTLTPQSKTLSYPQSTLVTVAVAPTAASATHTPKGNVLLQDASSGFTTLGTLSLQGNGTGKGVASFYLSGLTAGVHNLVAKYAGDSLNPGGLSVPVAVTVQPAVVKLTVSCSGLSVVAGANYACKVYTTPILAGSNSVLTYQFDTGAPVAVAFSGGSAAFSIPTPGVGQHTVVVSYAAQGNYGAAASVAESFAVTLK